MVIQIELPLYRGAIPPGGASVFSRPFAALVPNTAQFAGRMMRKGPSADPRSPAGLRQSGVPRTECRVRWGVRPPAFLAIHGLEMPIHDHRRLKQIVWRKAVGLLYLEMEVGRERIKRRNAEKEKTTSREKFRKHVRRRCWTPYM